jgi:hypothetical protein
MIVCKKLYCYRVPVNKALRGYCSTECYEEDTGVVFE